MGLLNYGEPQILELFKNMLPSQLYYMLYQINDLRTAVETVKRILTKEKLDKQKIWETSASPFMKASKESKKKSNEKGVSFDALDTIDRHSDSMDKLASLVSKLDMKLDKQETHYKPKIYQGRNRGHGQRQDSYRSRDRSYSRDCNQYNYQGRGSYNYNNRNYRSNYRNRDRSRNGYGYRRNNGQNYRRNYGQNYGNQRYRNRSPSQDCSRSRQRYRSHSQDRSNSRNSYSNNSRDQSRGRQGSNSNDRDNNRTRSRSNSCVSTNRDRLRCYRCSEYDHFTRECPNTLTDESSDESEGTTLQMLTQDETPVLDYSEMELDGDLNM